MLNHDQVGVLVVNSAVGLTGFLLSRLRIIDVWRGKRFIGFWLTLGPLGLLAWIQRDATLALALALALIGVLLLLREERKGQTHGR